MLQTDVLESAIFDQLARVSTCTLEELAERLPYYSWSQVFSAVDRLSREGTVALQRSDSFGYLVSLGPRRSTVAHHVSRCW